jgi:hypothetical protein
MTQKKFTAILKLPWTHIEEGTAEVAHIAVDKQEFYAFAYMGNLLFTPEEIRVAHQRFEMYPKTDRAWTMWTLSEDDIKALAASAGINIEGIDMDTIAHFFKKGFLPMVDSWEDVLINAIEQARDDEIIHKR